MGNRLPLSFSFIAVHCLCCPLRRLGSLAFTGTRYKLPRTLPRAVRRLHTPARHSPQLPTLNRSPTADFDIPRRHGSEFLQVLAKELDAIDPQFPPNILSSDHRGSATRQPCSLLSPDIFPHRSKQTHHHSNRGTESYSTPLLFDCFRFPFYGWLFAKVSPPYPRHLVRGWDYFC